MLNRMGVKILVLLAVLVASLVVDAQARADESHALSERISGKLIRGLVNLSTGWIEVPRQIYEVGTHEGWVRGVLRGPFDGIGMFFARTVAGAVETATFPVPLPTYTPLLKPAYVWGSEDPSDMIAADSK